MNCTDFELAVQDRLDARETGLSPELAAHTVACAACREFWRGQQALLRATASWPTVEVPAGLVSAVLAQLAQSETALSSLQVVSSTPSRTSRRGAWAAICSAAALVLLSVSFIGTVPTSPSAPSVALSRIPSTDTMEAPETAVVSQTLAGLWNGVRSEYQELAQNAALPLDDWAELKRTAAALPEFPSTEASSDATSAELQVPAWLRLDRPVSERAVQAFDFLRHAVPQDGSRSS